MLNVLLSISFLFFDCTVSNSIDIYMTTNETLVYNQLKNDGYTKESIAAVMGVVGGESAFTQLVENSYLGTSNTALRNIFYKLRTASDAQITQCKTSDYNFFNCVYGGEAGNSPTEGYKYRGRGFNGITFKGNYEYVQDGLISTYNINYNLVDNPQLLERTDIAAKALSYWFRSVKNISDFETAFQESYRRNAGYGNSFAYYQSSTNLVHVQGIPLKRQKGQYYLNLINQGAFPTVNTNTSSGIVNSTFILPLLIVISFGAFYLYKKFKK